MLAVAADAVTAVNGAKGKTVINPAVVPTVVSQGIDTAVAVINLVQQAHATPATPVKAGRTLLFLPVNNSPTRQITRATSALRASRRCCGPAVDAQMFAFTLG